MAAEGWGHHGLTLLSRAILAGTPKWLCLIGLRISQLNPGATPGKDRWSMKKVRKTVGAVGHVWAVRTDLGGTASIVGYLVTEGESPDSRPVAIVYADVSAGSSDTEALAAAEWIRDDPANA